MARQIEQNQTYRDRLLRLIPSEIVATYLVLQGMIPAQNARWGLTIVSLVLLILTPFYLWKFEKVKGALQITCSSVSFVVWIYSLGGPFIHWQLYKPWAASVVLVLWTLAIPLFVRNEPK